MGGGGAPPTNHPMAAVPADMAGLRRRRSAFRWRASWCDSSACFCTTAARGCAAEACGRWRNERMSHFIAGFCSCERRPLEAEMQTLVFHMRRPSQGPRFMKPGLPFYSYYVGKRTGVSQQRAGLGVCVGGSWNDLPLLPSCGRNLGRCFLGWICCRPAACLGTAIATKGIHFLSVVRGRIF